MKITSVWRGNKPNHKKKRTVPKLRIRWTQLGLVDPSVDAARAARHSRQRPARAHARTSATRTTRRPSGS